MDVISKMNLEILPRRKKAIAAEPQKG